MDLAADYLLQEPEMKMAMMMMMMMLVMVIGLCLPCKTVW